MKFYTDRPREKHLNVLRVLNSSLLDFFFFLLAGEGSRVAARTRFADFVTDLSLQRTDL